MLATVLYLDFEDDVEIHRRQIDGIRRFAKARGWTVATLPCGAVKPPDVPDAIRRIAPVGCVVGCTFWYRVLPASAFGGGPVVYLNPPVRLRRRWNASVVCDNAAVARMAFRELSSGLPSAYGVVDEVKSLYWARERTKAFRALCRESGMPCHVFAARRDEDAMCRAARLARWASSLPPHCAVFAVNDLTADEVTRAFRAVGRSVPRTATLVGADALDVSTHDGPVPTLSSVRIDFEQAGYLAARLLSETMTGTPQPRPSLHFTPPGVKSFGPLLVERRESTRGRGRRTRYILQAVEAIRREACDGLTAAALAARFPGSRKLFERRFREAMGHSVLDEILDIRMKRAMDLLSRPDIAIGSIYFRCGFASDRELRSLFLSRIGVSMRRWRTDRMR